MLCYIMCYVFIVASNNFDLLGNSFVYARIDCRLFSNKKKKISFYRRSKKCNNLVYPQSWRQWYSVSRPARYTCPLLGQAAARLLNTEHWPLDHVSSAYHRWYGNRVARKSLQCYLRVFDCNYYSSVITYISDYISFI